MRAAQSSGEESVGELHQEAALVKSGAIVLDCSDPDGLAEFYRQLLGADECPGATSNRTDIQSPGGLRIAFRRDLNATPPSWPRPEDSLQAHLDFLVEERDIDAVERRIVALGGTPVDASDRGDQGAVRQFADPAGHSFTVRSSVRQAPKTD
ncbi:VOC family protein [Streptomyces sp. NPDC046716]|uniref:VOC family protein n=1 Tax=Streptomyces sp. NPDC046716 TaxID=3157093 RepID=UPI0033CFADA4